MTHGCLHEATHVPVVEEREDEQCHRRSTDAAMGNSLLVLQSHSFSTSYADNHVYVMFIRRWDIMLPTGAECKDRFLYF